MIKISALDRLFSDYIRTKYGWECVRCPEVKGSRSVFRPPARLIDNFPQFESRSRSAVGLHNAHCFSRGGYSVRWNEEDCVALCYGCHSYLDRNPYEKYEFFESRLGKERFEELRRLSKRTVLKIDREAIKVSIQEKLERLLNE